MSDQSEYRAFRTHALEQGRDAVKRLAISDYDESADVHSRFTQRIALRAARRWVQNNVSELLAEDPDQALHIRRMLGIPASQSLIKPEAWPWYGKLGIFFVPHWLTWQYTRRQLAKTRTYEGRAFLYETFYDRVVTCRLNRYTPAVDQAIQGMPLLSYERARQLDRLDAGWFMAVRKVGVESFARIEHYARYGSFRLKGPLANLLALTNVVQTESELAWLDYQMKERYHAPEITPEALRTFKQAIDLLLANGVKRKQVAGIFRHDLDAIDPDRLQVNLQLIVASGTAGADAVYEVIGESLWRASSANWAFVLDVVKAHSADQIQHCKRMLDHYCEPSSLLVEHLIALGASVEDLAHCQTLILELNKKEGEGEPLAEIALLAGAPYCLSFEQIGQCRTYLARPGALQEYLAVLERHGYGYPEAVLGFQRAYTVIGVQSLETWLVIKGHRKPRKERELVDWIIRCAGTLAAQPYHYLLTAVPMPEFSHLCQAERVVRFGLGTLQYLVENKGLNSFKAIMDWYYKARGVHTLCCWDLNSTSCVLLDDAFRRNHFAAFTENLSCVIRAIDDRVVTDIGYRHQQPDDAARERYDERREVLAQAESLKLLSRLPAILNQTGGVLLPSMIRHAWSSDEQLQEQMDALVPLVENLLMGRGPSGAELQPQEVEAISMIYKADSHSVRSQWKNVLGLESQMAGLTLWDGYPMRWARSIRRMEKRLERSSLQALVQAKTISAKICSKRDFTDACQAIRSKRLYDKSRDPQSVAAHLGVLFAASREDSLIGSWLETDLGQIAALEDFSVDISEGLEQLDTLFTSTLPDALEAHMPAFVMNFNDEQADSLAKRMVGEAHLAGAQTGRGRLQAAVRHTQTIVLATCACWLKREQGKFTAMPANDEVTELQAFVSKYPAAFFARQAANLCTRDDTDMWKEERHAHMVVFDPVQRRLAGMAMIYFESIPALHPTKRCLIVRAINPMDEMLATHTVHSIVNAFFDVAVSIAQENELAAVLFPNPGGMHLLSNQSTVEKYFKKRLIERAEPYRQIEPGASAANWRTRPRRLNTRFYAYAEGQQQVSELYAVWANNQITLTAQKRRSVEYIDL